MNQLGESSERVGDLLKTLFPLNRGLAGRSNRATLDILKQIAPIETIEVPSGESFSGWTIPREWSLRSASISDSTGNIFVDASKNPLHVHSNSVPIRTTLEFSDLLQHLVCDEGNPEAIPYRTSYYQEDWGFSVTKKQLDDLSRVQGPLLVHIDSEFTDGSMSMGEIVLPGREEKEILVSSYICHPYMANDGVSGMLVAALLAEALLQRKTRRYTYRFVFAPETIGAITYMSLREKNLLASKFGIVITTSAGNGSFAFKSSFRPDSHLNTLGREALRQLVDEWTEVEFDFHGSDERQFSSSGMRMEVISFLRPGYYKYPEYHTSLDDLEVVTPHRILESLNLHLRFIDLVESERYFSRTGDYGEPMLSKYELYPKRGGGQNPNSSSERSLDKLLGVLFWSDGLCSTTEMSRILGLEPQEVVDISEKLVSIGILEEREN
jgi:aminopeptidase-like protein